MTYMAYKILARLLLIGGVAALLTGCGSSQEEDDSKAGAPGGASKLKVGVVQDAAAPSGVQPVSAPNQSAPAQDAPRPQFDQ